jgi:hypothetical protein
MQRRSAYRRGQWPTAGTSRGTNAPPWAYAGAGPPSAPHVHRHQPRHGAVFDVGHRVLVRLLLLIDQPEQLPRAAARFVRRDGLVEQALRQVVLAVLDVDGSEEEVATLVVVLLALVEGRLREPFQIRARLRSVC